MSDVIDEYDWYDRFYRGRLVVRIEKQKSFFSVECVIAFITKMELLISEAQKKVYNGTNGINNTGKE